MSNLSELLASKQLPQEPEAFPIIRHFVEQQLQVTPGLQLRDGAIIISMPNAAAAGALRFQLPTLRQKLGDDVELVIARA